MVIGLLTENSKERFFCRDMVLVAGIGIAQAGINFSILSSNLVDICFDLNTPRTYDRSYS